MAELEISIGGRLFSVACQPGEEQFLHSAAAMLDAEARPLLEQLGRLPEARLLLMSGLMLADRTAALEDEVARLRGQVAELTAELEAPRPEPEPMRIEVPVIPPQIGETFAEIAARAESLAAALDEQMRRR